MGEEDAPAEEMVGPHAGGLLDAVDEILGDEGAPERLGQLVVVNRPVRAPRDVPWRDHLPLPPFSLPSPCVDASHGDTVDAVATRVGDRSTGGPAMTSDSPWLTCMLDADVSVAMAVSNPRRELGTLQPARGLRGFISAAATDLDRWTWAEVMREALCVPGSVTAPEPVTCLSARDSPSSRAVRLLEESHGAVSHSHNRGCLQSKR